MPDGCHLRFEEYLQGKNTCSSVSMILKLCQLIGKCLKKRYEEVMMLKT